jgi:hypothetical protein
VIQGRDRGDGRPTAAKPSVRPRFVVAWIIVHSRAIRHLPDKNLAGQKLF